MRLHDTLLIEIDRRVLEHIVFKNAFFHAAVWETHGSLPMLNSADPLPFVTGSVRPKHFSVAVTLVIFVAPSVDIAGLPSKRT